MFWKFYRSSIQNNKNNTNVRWYNDPSFNVLDFAILLVFSITTATYLQVAIGSLFYNYYATAGLVQVVVLPSINGQDATVEYAHDRIIVKLKTNTSPQTGLASLNAKYEVKSIRKLVPFLQTSQVLDLKFSARTKRAPKNAVVPNLNNMYLVDVDPKTDILSTVSEYKKNPNVEYAEPDYKVKVQMIPNDPYYSSSNSWGQGFDDLWGLKKLDMQHAWDITQGNGVIVAVIDTGVDYNHPDIASNMWTNTKEISGNGIDDDNNGYIDDVKGWDFVGSSVNSHKPDNDPIDGYGHGTHVAGTIAAVGNNNLGVIGIAPQSKIMAVKGLDDSGSGYISDLASAVVYATDNGANILNNSWGGRGFSQSLTDAFHYAYSKGVVAIAAAGNSSQDTTNFTPANIDTVITVASTDTNDAKSSFSNFGYKVDVAAPGENILSLRAANKDMYGDGTHIVNTNYYLSNGTSMACPHVVGVAALLMARFPSDLSTDIKGRIMAGVDSFPATPGMVPLGTGRTNAYKALTSVPTPLISLQDTKLNDIGDGDQSPESNEQIQLTITLKNIWKNASSVTVTLSSTDPSIASIPTSVSNFGSIAQDETKSNSTSPFVFKIGQIQYEAIATFNLTVNADGIIKTIPLQVRLGIGTLNLSFIIGFGDEPTISGNKIVWSNFNGSGDGTDIYLYDLDTNQERRITTDPSPKFTADISGNKIVWVDNRNGDANADIYLYDLDTNQERRITTASAHQFNPDISGNKIVWTDYRNGNTDIYLYDLDTNQERRITTASADQSNPDISGNKIVWTDNRNGNADIYLYDLSTNQERQITTDLADQYRPVISDNKIVWVDARNGDADIYLYDLSTNQERRITTNSSRYLNPPSISGNHIAWSVFYDGVYMYDLATNQKSKIASINSYPAGIVSSPDISNNKIVWYFSPNPNPVERKIFVAEIPSSTNPIPTTTSISPTSKLAGGAGFTLTVDGTNFISNSVVKWNGLSKTTTYVSPTQLKAIIPSTDLTTAGTFNITVFNPTPGGGTSNAQTFTVVIGNPVPTIIITSPTGGEQWQTGSTRNINWSSTGVSNISINISRPGATVNIVSNISASSGSYSWTIPSSFSARNDYYVQIIGDGRLVSNGNTFSIVAPTPSPSPSPSPKSTGPNAPGTTADDASFGTSAWSNTDGAKLSDNNVASTQNSFNVTSHYLKVTNFGFSIPTDATINGITVKIERRGTSTAMKDKRVRLVKGGVVGTTDKADTLTAWPASDTIKTYGSASDLWSDTWTPANINASNFGAVLSAGNIGLDTGAVDQITITINYTQ